MSSHATHQAFVLAGTTTVPTPATLVPAGFGLSVQVNGRAVRYSRTSTASLTIAAAATQAGPELARVDLYVVPLGSLTAEAVLDFPSIAAQAQASLTIAVPGAEVGDAVSLGLPAAPAAGIGWDAFVSAAGVVTVRATNATAAAVDPASATYRVLVDKA